MSAVDKTPIQIYYWKVEFSDKTILAQFDEYGNEILIRNICPAHYFITDPITKQKLIPKKARVFEGYEKIHGKVTKIGWYPYTAELAEKATKKNNTLRIATNPELDALKIEVPAEYYVGAPTNISKVEFAVKMQKGAKVLVPTESLQHQLALSLFSYDNSIAPIVQKWLVNYK